MYAEVLLKAFEKAQIETGSDKPWHQAQHLSDVVQEMKGGPYSPKSLDNKRKEALKNKKGEISVRKEVIDALCRYLGYADYQDYLANNPDSKPNDSSEKKRRFSRKPLLLAASIAGLILISFGVYRYSQPRFMVWKGTHYEEVEFDLKKYRVNELKAYKQERIENFKKLMPDCSFQFFDDAGIERLWYGKNKKGELEFFTDLAQHPETGKTLKKITPYMIKKYICPTYPE